MNKYIESIQSLDDVGTSVYEQVLPEKTPILEMSGDAPATTYLVPSPFMEEISQESVSYSAPQKVKVRTYRLRK